MFKQTLVLFFLAFSFQARADFMCRSADQQSDLRLETFAGVSHLTLHSAELSDYVRIGYNIDLGRLELVHEFGGAAVLTHTPDGLTALLYAPASERADLTWYLEFTQSGHVGHASLSGSGGEHIEIDLLCSQ